jgi:hypothetical protein
MGETKADDAAPSRSLAARHLAEQGLQQQALGNDAEAERLLAEAQSMDADTVAEVLREHDAGRAPDARLQDTADKAMTLARRGHARAGAVAANIGRTGARPMHNEASPRYDGPRSDDLDSGQRAGALWNMRSCRPAAPWK